MKARLMRPAVAWLLALVIPFQTLTAVYLDLDRKSVV